MSETKKIPEHVLEVVSESLGVYPSLVQTHILLVDALHNLMRNTKEIWVNQFMDDKKEVRLEGLLKYNDSDVFIYYRAEDDYKTYRFVYMFPISSRDTVMFGVSQLNQYKTRMI